MNNILVMQVDENELPVYQATYDTYSSLKEYCWFNSEQYNVVKQKEFSKIEIIPETNIVYSGSVEYCYSYYTNKISVEAIFEDIPFEFIQRKVWFGYKKDIRKDIFIKPLEHVKLFTGFVVTDLLLLDFVTDNRIEDTTRLFMSDKLSIKDEYRVWFDGKKEIDIRPYYKDTNFNLDLSIVSKCNKYISEQYNNPFVADYGILTSGETVLIEVNDIHGTGTYGFNGPNLWKTLIKSKI
jgi:hypothetical protein